MNRHYCFLYVCNDDLSCTNDCVSIFKEGCLQHLKLCKGSVVLNYEHMYPIETYTLTDNNINMSIHTTRMSGEYGKYMGMPMNEGYYHLLFNYSDIDNQYNLSDSSFLQLCSRNKNSVMECVKYNIKNVIPL